MKLALVAATAILAATASQAEARARFKFRSSAPTLSASPKAVPAAAKSEGAGFLPGAAIGASIGSRPARAREEVTTSSTAPARTVMPLVPGAQTAAQAAPSAAKPAKPAFVCAGDRTFGAGSGFCEIN